MGSPLGSGDFDTSAPGAVTGGDGSVSALVNNTQANVTSALQAQQQASPAWNGASGTFFGTILGGFSSGPGLVTSATDDLLASLCDAITGFTSGLIDLSGWATSLRADATTALDGTSTISTGITNEITGALASSLPAGVAPAVQLLNYTVQASGSTPLIDIYNTPGTWTAAPAATTVDLALMAASGGSAQGGMGTTGAAGGAGGAGGYSVFTGIAVSGLPSSCAVDVGVGGTGGQNAVTSDQTTFVEANTTNLGSVWRIDSGTASPQVLNDAAEAAPMSSGSGENGMWATRIGTALLSDDYIIQAQLTAPTNSEATNNYSGVYVAAPVTYGAGTKLVVFAGNTGSGCGLFTQTNAPAAPYIANGAQTGQTVVASIATPFTNTSLIALGRVGNVFTGYIDGAAIVTWTDTGNTVPTGSGDRGWGFVVEGNYPSFQQQFDSPAISTIGARDIGVNSQPGTDGGDTSFNGASYVATGGTGGVGGGIDSGGTRRPSSGSFLLTDTAWNGTQGTGNQGSINPAGGIGAAGQSSHSPSGAAGGDGLNTGGGAAGTSGSLNGAPGTSPAGGVYGPGSGGGGGYWVTGITGQAGQGGAGAFPGGAPGGGGATLDGQGSNGPGNAGSDGQAVVTTRFT